MIGWLKFIGLRLTIALIGGGLAWGLLAVNVPTIDWNVYTCIGGALIGSFMSSYVISRRKKSYDIAIKVRATRSGPGEGTTQDAERADQGPNGGNH